MKDKEKKKGSLQLQVDQRRCTSAGVCVQTCPEVFFFQPGSKKATVRRAPVSPEHEEQALLAMARCPRQAIYPKT